jgi:3-hydroxy-9,10-secoandrosta-1,3,5(10)-triene-9,17-dione monooxygenase
VNDGALFRVPIVASAGHPLSATVLGTAEGAYEHVANAFKTRMGTYTGAKVSDFQAVQVKLAKARCLIDSARYLMRESALVFQDNSSLEIEAKLRLRAQNAFAVSQSREAVETLWSFYGANAIYTRDPLQRYLRDVQAASQHFSFNFDIAGAAFGTAALGGKYANPTL